MQLLGRHTGELAGNATLVTGAPRGRKQPYAYRSVSRRSLSKKLYQMYRTNNRGTDSLLRSLIIAPRRWTRRAYDWTLHWADTPQSLAALFGLALAESSVFPIPPDVLLIAIVAARPSVWLSAAGLCTAGSLVGAAIGYGIGAWFITTIGDPIIAFYGAQDDWGRFVSLVNTWGVWFVAAAAFTPIPFKVATIASGATGISFITFATVSMIGRAARFFLVALSLRIYGARLRRVLEDNFDLASFLFFILVVMGFLVLRYL